MKKQLDYEQYHEMYIVKQMKTKDIAEYFNVSTTTIRKRLHSLNIPVRTAGEHARKNYFNQDFFKTIDTENKAYWLGMLYADGHVRKKEYGYEICLSQIDFNIIEKFAKDIQYVGHIGTYIMGKTSFLKKDGTRSHYKKIGLTSKSMYDDLVQKGCFENKSLTLCFPSKNQVPKHLINHFIRGYFDGDGSVFITKSTRVYGKRIAIAKYLNISICGTLEFLTSLQKELNFLPKDCKVIHKEKRTKINCYNMRFTSNVRSLSFEKFIYENATVFSNKKRETFRDYNENYKK